VDEAFALEVEAIDWFASCGRGLAIDLPLPYVAVTTAEEAARHCSAPAWEELTDAAAGRLGDYVRDRCPAAYAGWNPLTEATKRRLTAPLMSRVWQPFADRHGFGGWFVLGVQWDVLHAAMEHEYRECAGRPEFFGHLLRVYRAGHLPCGWSGECPEGQLLVW
jgi:hypothetical protein